MNILRDILGVSQKVATFWALGLLLVACEKPFVPSETSEDTSTFRVLSSSTDDITFRGGTGTIILSEAPDKVTSAQEWLTATISGSTISLQVQPNTDYDSRTGKVIVSKGDNELMIPITQLGTINIIALESMEFPATGGVRGFTFKPGEDYTITGLEETPWLTYEVRNDSIFFQATEIGANDPARTVTGRLKVGNQIDKEFVISQKAFQLTYDMLPGLYQISFSSWVGERRSTITGALASLDKENNLLLLVIPDYALVVSFDPNDITLSLKGQELIDNKLQLGGVWLAPWESMGDGSLYPSPNFGLKGVWNEDKSNPVFTFVPDGVTDPSWVTASGESVIVRGFILWGENEVKDLQPSRFVEPILTRIGDLPEGM